MSETIDNTRARLAAFLAANAPSVDVGPGSVLSELLLKLEAAVQNEQYNLISALDQGKTLSAVAANGSGTSTVLMDNIASNYGVTRALGKVAAGSIKVTVAQGTDLILPRGFSFIQTALNLQFTIAADVHVSATGRVSSVFNEVPTYTVGQETFFIVPVVAAAPGAQYNIAANTVLAVVPPGYISGFVGAKAYGSFSGGLAPDDDLALFKRISVNFGSDRLDSPAGIQTCLSNTFPSFQSLSACGVGDAELLRTKQNALGISTLGMADIYVRTSVNAQVQPFRKTATKIADGLWEVAIDSTTAPGFYKIVSILPAVSGVLLGGTLVVTDVAYSWMSNIGERNNVISSYLDARFTKYQQAVAQFSYNEVPAVAVGTTTDVDVFLSYQPYIADIQNLFLADSSRVLCADYLVKAALPCFVSLDIKLVGKPAGAGIAAVDLVSLKKDIFNYVNTIPFGEALEASRIVNLCHNYNIRRVNLPIAMSGVILCNDGSSIYIDATDELTIPTDIARGVSTKTTQYFIDYYQPSANSPQLVDSIGITLT